MKHLLLFMAGILSALSLGAQAPQEDLDAQYATDLLAPGTPAPEFSLKDLDGNAVSFSSFRGKTVVLVFWASWCPDCRAEVPDLKAMAAAADPAKVAFVSVSFDRSFDTLLAFARENALPGVQLFDPSGKKDSAVGAAYHVKWIPSLYVVNPEGQVALGTVVAAKVAALLSGAAEAPEGLTLPRNLCTDESCAL